MTAVDPRTVHYRPLPPDQAPGVLEDEMLARWTEEDILARTLAAREGRENFVFFEGPPTANGKPGIHHVFSRTIKDLFCRYHVMKGRRVLRKAGWDTHGLPVEIEVEKQLGISGKQQIEEIGVERFNQLCRESVWKYRADWERLSARIAFWLDYDNPYVTYVNDYIESVWWALATLHAQDLLYRGHKILPYCPRCGTALSTHEVAQGYEDVRDPSVYVALELMADGKPSRRVLVWTTTPWTLVSNVALAVHPELTYVELVRRERESEGTIILAEARAGAVLGEDWPDRWDVVKRLEGRALVGLEYRRPLDWVPIGTGAHEVIVAESFVSADDGSGIVHMAPAFGADDYAAGQRHGLAFLQPVDARGEFTADIPVVGGKFVKDADALIIEELRRRGSLWKAATLEHSYPHCWRCGTPLLYYARESWFVRTTAYRDRMLARNASTGTHRKRGSDDLGSGSRTTSTGRSHATATGVRRFRSGSATARQSTRRRSARMRSSPNGWAGRCLPTSIRTSRSSTGSNGPARCARARCGAFPASSTRGSTRARCRSRSGTTPSRIATFSPRNTRPTSLPKVSTRRAAGSTRCWRLRPASGMSCLTIRSRESGVRGRGAQHSIRLHTAPSS